RCRGEAPETANPFETEGSSTTFILRVGWHRPAETIPDPPSDQPRAASLGLYGSAPAAAPAGEPVASSWHPRAPALRPVAGSGGSRAGSGSCRPMPSGPATRSHRWLPGERPDGPEPDCD